MDGNINLNSLYSGLAMIASLCIAAPVINKLGLRGSYVAFIGLAFVSSLIYILAPVSSN